MSPRQRFGGNHLHQQMELSHMLKVVDRRASNLHPCMHSSSPHPGQALPSARKQPPRTQLSHQRLQLAVLLHTAQKHLRARCRG